MSGVNAFTFVYICWWTPCTRTQLVMLLCRALQFCWFLFRLYVLSLTLLLLVAERLNVFVDVNFYWLCLVVFIFAYMVTEAKYFDYVMLQQLNWLFSGSNTVVSCTWSAARLSKILDTRRRMVNWMHIWRDGISTSHLPWWFRNWPAVPYIQVSSAFCNLRLLIVHFFSRFFLHLTLYCNWILWLWGL